MPGPSVHRVCAPRPRAMSDVSVLIVDDHAIVRQTVEMYLASEPGVAVWATAGSGEEALSLLEQAAAPPPPPDVALVDVQMPGINGFELVAELTSRYPAVVCVMLSAHGGPAYAARAEAAGARGFIQKNAYPELPAAIRRAAEQFGASRG